MDAADDLPDDLKDGASTGLWKKNRACAVCGRRDARKRSAMRRTANATPCSTARSAMVVPAANLLPQGQFTGILENILHARPPRNAAGDPVFTHKAHLEKGKGIIGYDRSGYKRFGVSPSASDEEVKDATESSQKKISSRPVCGQPAFGAGERKDEGDQRGVRHDRRTAQEPHNGRLCVRRRAQQRHVELQRRAQLHHVRPHCGMRSSCSTACRWKAGMPSGFLKGTVLFRRGWLRKRRNTSRAPARWTRETREYQAALNQAMNQRSGVYGGYNPNMSTSGVGGCNACDMCQG